MTIGDMKFKLEVTTDIVPISQRGLLEDFLDKETFEWGIENIEVLNEYDHKYEDGDKSSHVYYILHLEIPFIDITNVLDSIVSNMKSKDTVIKHVKIRDKYISAKCVQYEQ